MQAVVSGQQVFFDEEDGDLFRAYRWEVYRGTTNSYLRRRERMPNGRRRTVSFHREVTNAPSGMEVDHINRNGLDNRRSNLRIVSHEQNSWNRRVPRNSSTGVANVAFDSSKNKFKIHFQVASFEEAVVAANAARAALDAYRETLRVHDEAPDRL